MKKLEDVLDLIEASMKLEKKVIMVWDANKQEIYFTRVMTGQTVDSYYKALVEATPNGTVKVISELEFNEQFKDIVKESKEKRYTQFKI